MKNRGISDEVDCPTLGWISKQPFLVTGPASRKVILMIDILFRLRAGKGLAYEKWARS